MSLEDLGNLGEFIGSIGVVVTLIYLAIQIRQNTRQLASNALQGLTDRMEGRLLTVSTDERLTELLTKNIEAPEALTVQEHTRLSAWVAIWVSDLEETYRQSIIGSVPEYAIKNRLANMQGILSTPTTIALWINFRQLADPDFIRWADAHLDLDVPPLETATPTTVKEGALNWSTPETVADKPTHTDDN